MAVSVLVPSSLTRESRDKREATRKLGYVARAATIFRVDRLVIYPDNAGEHGATLGGGFVETVLRYAATPPFLRKEEWSSRDELEYAGVLPPLCIRPRTGSGSDDSGSLRQGIVTEVGSDDRVRVNCGLQHPISLHVPADRRVTEGERVAVRILSRRPVRAQLADVPFIGPSVVRMDLLEALDRGDAGHRIAASRHGEELTIGRLSELITQIETAGLTVALGAPQRGLVDILSDHPGTDAPIKVDTSPDTRFDHWLNTIPRQGSDVVRTEEAMFATLACLTLTE